MKLPAGPYWEDNQTEGRFLQDEIMMISELSIFFSIVAFRKGQCPFWFPIYLFPVISDQDMRYQFLTVCSTLSKKLRWYNNASLGELHSSLFIDPDPGSPGQSTLEKVTFFRWTGFRVSYQPLLPGAPQAFTSSRRGGLLIIMYYYLVVSTEFYESVLSRLHYSSMLGAGYLF